MQRAGNWVGEGRKSRGQAVRGTKVEIYDQVQGSERKPVWFKCVGQEGE